MIRGFQNRFCALLIGCSLLLRMPEMAAQDKPLKGFSIIEKVLSSGAEPVYQVDGYQVRIVASTERDFRDSVNSLVDVHAGSWVRFSGTLDVDGTVVAQKAVFYPMKTETQSRHSPQAQVVAPATESLIDADGNFKPLHSKVRLSNAGGWCGWHRVPAEGEEQARVRRIGNRLVPPYLQKMAEDGALPPFRFFVVDEKDLRSELACNPGLILVPRTVIDRLKTDDQVAAVIAQGIAYNIQYLRARLIARDRWLTAAQIADAASLAMNPFAALATNSATGVVMREHNIELELERGRLALSMMFDGGFDARQAPEAWKLLAPKRLPRDLGSLKYPRIGQYQLTVLEAQYRNRNAEPRKSKAEAN